MRESDERVFECAKDDELVQRDGEEVFIISPTFKDKVRVRSPTCRFGHSKNAMKDLVHVES